MALQLSGTFIKPARSPIIANNAGSVLLALTAALGVLAGGVLLICGTTLWKWRSDLSPLLNALPSGQVLFSQHFYPASLFVGQFLVATHFGYLLPEQKKRAYRQLIYLPTAVELCASMLNPPVLFVLPGIICSL